MRMAVIKYRLAVFLRRADDDQDPQWGLKKQYLLLWWFAQAFWTQSLSLSIPRNSHDQPPR